MAYMLGSGYLLVYAGAIPLLVLILWAFIFQSRAHEFHVTILGFIISLILTSFLTDVVKNSVGRPRPDLIARCKPEKDTPEHTLVTIDICTETDHHTLHDGWRSFPSGHSSFAFSGLGYLALFVHATGQRFVRVANIYRFFAGQMHVFRPHTDLARVLLTLAPLIGAAMIAISRCEDYRHDVYDVTTGSLLGIFVAYFSYRRYYPGLSSSHCDEPYPSRAETANMNGFAKVRDEEDGIADANTIAMMDLGTGLESGPVRQARGDDGRSSGSRNDIR